MIKFLIKLSSFSILFLLVYIFSFFIFRSIEKKINSNIDENSLAIIGHSQPATSINDSLINTLTSLKVTNHGSGGQSMFWSIVGGRKLKYQGTRYFIIALTNSSYTTGWKTVDAIRGLREVNKKYFLNNYDWFFLLKKNFKFTIHLFFKPVIPKQKVSGKFKILKKQFVKENTNDSNIGIFHPDFEDDIIHQFIENNDSVFFIVLRTPLNPEAIVQMKKGNEQHFQERLTAFKEYSNCKIMDFGHKYSNDSLFADMAHMNYNGASIFTQFLVDTLLNVPELKRDFIPIESNELAK